MFQRIKNWVWAHKLISLGFLTVIVVVVILILLKTGNNREINHITEVVKKGNIITTVTGTGQVEASDTVDIKPKISGDITYLGVKVGQEVKAGTLIASLDAREAKIALENAELSLVELIKNPEPSALSQKENNVAKAYSGAWDTTSSAIFSMSSALDELDVLYDNYLGYQNIFSLGRTAREKVEFAEKALYVAEKSFRDLNNFYKTLSIFSGEAQVLELINKSFNTNKIIAEAIKETQTTLDYVISNRDDENNTTAIENKENLISLATTINGFTSSFLSLKNTILESTEALGDLLDGADEIDIKSAELTLQSKQNTYNDYFIRAPFDGIVAELTASVGDEVSSSIGTLITKQKVATISLNEVDIAQVLIGQKVNLTFDAIPGLTLTGKVSEISSIGTVNSGVVTYDIKIVFDNDDVRVKPGMSTNIEIITASQKDVLVVPSSAIKTRNNISSVEIFDDLKNIVKKEIKVGISDDTRTEIISGLNEGDEIILKSTVSGDSSFSSKNTIGPGGIDGGMPMGGSAIRMMR